MVRYLDNPLSGTDLARFLEMLPGEPSELVRQDNNFKKLGLDIGDYQSAEQVTDLLVEHPKLMQRPVVVRGDRAVIARPSELVEELL